MNASLEKLFDRVRSWPAERQQDAIDILETIDKHDRDLPPSLREQSDDFERRLKRAYDEGVASGDAGEIDVDALLAEFAEQAGRGA